MKDRFSYEVKDFVPTKRRTTKGTIIKICVTLGILIVSGLVAFGLYLNFSDKNKKKRDPKPSVIEVIEVDENGNEVVEEDTSEFVSYALRDFKNHAIGESSPLAKDNMLKLIKTGKYDASAKIRLSQMKDFGLGIENFVDGLAIKASLKADAAKKKFVGGLKGSWTVVGIDLLQFAYDEDYLRLSSEDFFKESIRIDKKAVGLFSSKIGPLLDTYSGMFGFKDDKDYQSFRKEIDNRKLADKSLEDLFKEYDIKIKCRRGEGENNYVVKFVSEKLENPYIINLSTNEKCELTGLSFELNFPELAKVTFSGTFTGEPHPSLKLNANLKIELKTFTVTAGLAYRYTTENNMFSVGIDGTDGKDKIYLKLNGELNTDRKMIKLSNLSFTLNDEKIVTCTVDVNLEEAAKNAADVEIPTKSNIINIMDVNKETIDSIVSQINSKISYYTKMFDFL